MKGGAVRRVWFAFAAIVAASAMTVAALLAADMYLHHRAEKSAGLNVWGYRGPAAGRKKPGETRVVVLGGSTVFGYGVLWDQAFPALLEKQLNASASDRFTVINLGYNSEGAYAFRLTLEDFAYLNYDVAILYEGYNDIIGDEHPNLAAYRHDSPVFRLTGYLPILPLVFREKAMALRAGGDLDAAYHGGKAVFTPDLSVRMGAAALDAAASVSDSIEQQLTHLSTTAPREAPASDGSCATPWRTYCASVARAIDELLAHQKKALVVGQPIMSTAVGRERQTDQHAALATMIELRYGRRSDVRFLDLRDAVDLRDKHVAPDGMHLTPGGNASIAARLVDPVLSLSGRNERRLVSSTIQ